MTWSSANPAVLRGALAIGNSPLEPEPGEESLVGN